jgi:small subunit ribosomal protein S14
MAKKSSIESNNNRRALVEKFSQKRSSLREKLKKKDLDFEERMVFMEQLASLPRNSSKTRVRNRCLLTGRSRGFYRKFRLSRIALRELASSGFLPGVTKASW